jgi:ATP-dependent helicase HrpB
MILPDLPIQSILPQLRESLAESANAVLAAPPGSGKTTVVPLALLNEPWLAGQRILMLEPRRLAARAAAGRMADLLGERVGETVGYQIRFERKVSAATRIEVITEGILTRRLQSDPELEGVGLILFDEFHERSLHADLALALALDVQQALREDLRLVAMSATLDSERVSRVLGDAPVIAGEGRSYPVEIRLAEREPEGRIAEVTAAGVRKALGDCEGDILCFLPGVGEIRQTAELLKTQTTGVAIHPLYGELSREEQDRAIRPAPAGPRRVVLATSIAETSLTIEGIHAVVDSGWSRRPRFDPNNGLTRLETLRVSRAAADQRAGRAGRLGPGVCYRLWSAATDSRLAPQHPPEILESDPAPLALELARWGDSDPASLNWIDPPPTGGYAQALELLQGLDALDDRGRITADGQRMAELGLHPRLAHLLLHARRRGQGELGADIAALLSERSPLRRRAGEPTPIDIEPHLELIRRFRQAGEGAVRRAGGDAAICRRIEQAAKRWREGKEGKRSTLPPLSIGALLALAYPDRIAQRRGGAQGGFRLSSGRGASVPESDPIAASDYLVAAQLDAGHRDGHIFLAAIITADELREVLAAHIQETERVEWNPASEAVEARQEARLGALVLDSRPLKQPDGEVVRAAMLQGIRRMGLEALPWSDAAQELRDRINCLREWQPDGGWPDLSDEALLGNLERWLAPWLDGISRRSHLQRLDLKGILTGQFDWDRQQALERLAPSHLQVPSGSRKRIQYQPGAAPVLAVRLQEMFGLADTPKVCDGEVPVMLHLLSPAQRPIQVTQDLKGFWERTYPEVKKELKGRYPKHYWPDDPWSATATARVRPGSGKPKK